jgi:hypothetical protein
MHGGLFWEESMTAYVYVYAVFWRHLLLAMVIDECDDL